MARISLALCPRRRRAARGARSRVRTGPCTIQIYVYAARDVRALTGTLSRIERREVAFVYTFSAPTDRPASRPTDRGPRTYVSPFRAHARACVSLARRLTPQAYDRPDRYSESLKGERSEKGESKTRSDANVRGGVERRAGVRRGSRHEPNRNQRPTRLDQHLDAFSLSPFFFSLSFSLSSPLAPLPLTLYFSVSPALRISRSVFGVFHFRRDRGAVVIPMRARFSILYRYEQMRFLRVQEQVEIRTR